MEKAIISFFAALYNDGNKDGRKPTKAAFMKLVKQKEKELVGNIFATPTVLDCSTLPKILNDAIAENIWKKVK